MNKYQELKTRQEKEMNTFPLGVCFSKQQFEEMMKNWGLTTTDTDKIYSVGGGCYIRKSDHSAFHEMLKRFEKERSEAIAADTTGEGFIYDMFLSELANHEYCITYDLDETLDALHLTIEQINADKRLLHGLQKARKEYLKHTEDY